ncbi:MAG TPA: tetratricopeptide repeat protein, partial [Phototrophicaceae bacterium]|nr:tetratricopeptide repeat protein [Phototrophicaceae bacterium]
LPEQLPQAQTLLLNRLSDDEIARLSYAMIGDSGEKEEVLQYLTRETEGNAFFLVEIVRALAEDAGKLSDIGSKTLPQSLIPGGIQQVVQRRIRQVPAWGQDMVRIAAIAGRQLDLAVLEHLQAMLPDLLTESLDHWLLACSDVHILTVQDNQWFFSHDKIRSQAIQEIEPDIVAELHGLIATALEAVYPNDRARAEVLMNHWRTAGNVDQELFYLNMTVEHLVWYTGEYLRAKTLIVHGLDLLSDSDPRRVNLLNHLSELFWRMGQFEEAKVPSLEALDLGEQIGSKPETARTLGNLGIIARMQRDYPTAQQYLVRSLWLRYRLKDQLGIARSYANLGNNAFSQSEFATARRHYLKSLGIQRELGERHGMALNLLNLGQLLHLEGKHDESHQYLLESLAIARETGNRYSVASTLNTLGIAAYLLGKDADALDYLQQSLVVFKQINNRYGASFTQGYLTNLLPVDQPDLLKTLIEGLQSAKAMKQTSFAIPAIVGSARYYFARNNPSQALKLAGFVKAQIAAEQPGNDNDVHVERFLKQARQTMDEATIQAGLETGKALSDTSDLWVVVSDLLAALQAEIETND